MKKIIITFCMFLILSISVFAFGVSTPFFDDSSLILNPGESRNVVLTIQNMAGATQDIQVQAEIINGNEIAEITDEETIYNVPAGSDNVPTNLEITMPEDANPGDTSTVTVEFKTINQEESGMVTLGLGAKISFDVITSEAIIQTEEEIQETKPKTQSITFLIIGIIIIVLILLLIKTFTKKSAKKEK